MRKVGESVWLSFGLAAAILVASPGCSSSSKGTERVECGDATPLPVTHTGAGMGPAFLGDADSDDNGLADRDEWGELEFAPADADNDGEPDYLDVDDDDDGLVDRFDAERLVALPQATGGASGESFGVLTRARVEVSEDAAALNAGRAGDRLIIEGAGLSCDALVAFVAGAKVRDPDDASAWLGPDTQMVVPISASATEVEVEVPALAGRAIRVILDGQRSDDLAFDSLDPAAPLLAAPQAFAARAGSTLTLYGRGLDGVDQVLFGATSVSPQTVSADSLEVAVPADATADEVQVMAGELASNAVDVRITETARATVPQPRGATRLVFGLDGEAALDGGAADIEIALLGPRLVEAVRDDDALVYTALVMPGASEVVVDAASSARALAITTSGAVRRIAPESLTSVDTLAASASEVTALAAIVDAQIAADPGGVWTAPTAEVVAAIAEAAEAVQAAVDAAVADGSLELRPEFETVAANANATTPQATIDPTEPQDDISVIQNPNTANVRVINDTQLNVSVRIRDTERRVDLQAHARSGYGSNVVGSQGPVSTLFSSKEVAFSQPQGRDALVEIITPGALAPAPTTDVGRETQRRLRLRSAVEKVLWPIFTTVLDVKLDPRIMTQVLLSQLPGAVGDFNDNLDKGNIGAALEALSGAVVRDLQEIGPVTQALLGATVRKLGPTAIRIAAQRLGRNLVPILNAFDAALSAASVGSATLDAVKALVDMASTHGVLEWTVLFDLSISRVHPMTIQKRDVDVGNIELFGAQFYPRRDAEGNFSLPTITFTDLDPTGFGAFVNDRSTNRFFISADGTHISKIVLPAGFVREAVGPIAVEIALAGDSSKAPEDIQVETDFELLALDPTVGAKDDPIAVTGRGFESDISFEFRERNAPTEEGAVRVAAVVQAQTETTATIVVPDLPAGIRSWLVRARQGSGFGLRSNGLPFSLPGGAYALTVIGPEVSVSSDINNSGVVAGTVGNDLAVFVWSESGGFVQQPYADGEGGFLHVSGKLSISDDGTLAGFFPSFTQPTGHLYSAGTVTAFDAAEPPPGKTCSVDRVYGITGAKAVGTVVCAVPGFFGASFASTWNPHQYLDAGFTEDKSTEALDVNGSGVAVGCAQFDTTSLFSPAVFSGSAMALPTPVTYSDACAFAVNESGQMVGYGRNGSTDTGLFWSSAASMPTTVTTPVGSIIDINDSGVMLGAQAYGERSTPGLGEIYVSEDGGATWVEVTKDYDFGGVTYTVVGATAINNDGTIAVSAKVTGGFDVTYAGVLVPGG
jgi:hypothetical protein